MLHEILHTAFGEVVLLLLVAAIAGVAALRLRQPLIIGFIAVGILAGPSGLNWIRSADQIHVLAEMGLALLLFVVGLKLDLHLIRSMGKVALATGIGQVVFTTIGGYLIALALGLSPITALYVAVALTFSSTIIVVKLLSDKRETDSLHGRIAIGFLIVQDIVVVLAMIALSAFTASSESNATKEIVLIAVQGVGLFVVIWFLSFYVIPRVLPMIARSTELLVLFSIAWALALALLGALLGFSKEVGAFAAGVSLASTTYRDLIGTKLVSLRDFLLIFFFLELGSRLDLNSLGAQVTASIPLSLFVLIGNPIIVMIIMGVMGYRKRTGFMAGLTVAQISEFSLILIAMGATVGHVTDEAVGIVTLVAIITIGLSTYMIIYAQPLYERLARYLHVFERKVPHREDADRALVQQAEADTIILIGLGNYGANIGSHLLAHGRPVLGVDFDPSAVDRWNARGERAVFGDAGDPDFAHALSLSSAQWVISSLRDPRVDAAIVHTLRQAGYHGLIALAAENRDDVPAHLREEADLLFVPFEDAAEQAVDMVTILEDELARKAMEKHIDTLSGHYVICGYGRMGQQIVKDFTRQGVVFVVVEDNPEQLPRLKAGQVPYVVGQASQDEVLTRAGILRARGLIAVASTDEENVFIVLSARGMNPALHIVARSIREENEDKLRRAGADHVMSPYILGGHRMAAVVTRPNVMDFLDLVLHSDAVATEIEHVVVPPTARCVHCSLRELALWQACGVTVLAVQRAGGSLTANPCPSFTLEAGDELILMGTPEQIDAVRAHLATAGADEESAVQPV